MSELLIIKSKNDLYDLIIKNDDLIPQFKSFIDNINGMRNGCKCRFIEFDQNSTDEYISISNDEDTISLLKIRFGYSNIKFITQ